ncbi:hypothetical protein [Sphingomonas sanxanigenens]|uniref:hypothetical protein n=1 Tax=Sphingomonas sanxanigenens TaxID=397260 RepID=UPI00130176A0|nr:hypothetical protein [Sphingomonas sanxanigenens]
MIDVVRRRFDLIRATRGEADRRRRRFCLPGYDLDMTCAGVAAGDLLCLAFDHRRCETLEGRNPALQWRIGDAHGIAGLPPQPDPPTDLHPLGSLHRNADNTVLIERRRGFTTVFDVAAMELTTIVDGPSAIDTDLVAKPLLRFLLPLLMRQGLVLCHAALLGGRDAGLLVTGRGGSGKSTISAAALLAGAGFCSDDFVALERRGEALVGHCIYASIMLGRGQIDHFPALAAHALRLRRDVFEKHMVPVAAAFPGQVRDMLRIDAVAVPEIVAAPRSELVTGSVADMLRAVAPTSVFSSPWREGERVRFLFDTISRLEPLAYRSGSDFGGIAAPLQARYGF